MNISILVVLINVDLYTVIRVTNWLHLVTNWLQILRGILWQKLN